MEWYWWCIIYGVSCIMEVVSDQLLTRLKARTSQSFIINNQRAPRWWCIVVAFTPVLNLVTAIFNIAALLTLFMYMILIKEKV